MNGGVIFIAIGVLFLLKNLGLLEGINWGIIWPLALIILGLNMMFKKRHCLQCGTTHGGTCSSRT